MTRSGSNGSCHRRGRMLRFTIIRVHVDCGSFSLLAGFADVRFTPKIHREWRHSGSTGSGQKQTLRARLGADESRTQLMWTPPCHVNDLPRLLFTSTENTSNSDEQIKRSSSAVREGVKHA